MKYTPRLSRILLINLTCLTLIPACSLRSRSRNDASSATSAPVPADTALEYTIGINEYYIEVQGDTRRFLLYVPTGYDPALPTPLMVMFHGSNQHPETMYNKTAWVEKADEETILIAFPASWEYSLIGESGLHEKWNDLILPSLVEPGTELKDDVGFVRAMLTQVQSSFNVDGKRIYASGFSNGSGFVLTRLLLEMNDVFAAFSAAGAGPTQDVDLSALPDFVDTSLYCILGTSDDKIAELSGFPLPFPFTEEEIIQDPAFLNMLNNTADVLDLAHTYSIEADPSFTRLTYDTSLSGGDNEYIFMMILDMNHVYPNGENNPGGIDASDLFWDIFVEHPRP